MEFNFEFFDSILNPKEVSVNTQQIKKNSHIPQFKILENDPNFEDLFIISNNNVNVYKETLIRRIKTRETWKKNPKQIIQEIAGVKPSIKKLLNQLVADNEQIICTQLLDIDGINNRENLQFLIDKLFEKILNEKTFINTILNLISTLNKEFTRKFKIRYFLSSFKKLIIDFIQNDLKDCEDREKIETFGMFMKQYLLSNIDKPKNKLNIISLIKENYCLNAFIVLFSVFIKQVEIVKEVIQLVDKTEEIKKKVNVKDEDIVKFFYEYDYDNIFVETVKTIKDNGEILSGIYKFKLMEFKDYF